MNQKQLIAILLALVVLGGAGLMLRHRNQESWNASGDKLGQKVLPNFQVNDVTAMHIQGATDLNLVKKNDRWCVQERDDYPANFSQISDLLIKLGDLKIAQAEDIGPSQLSRMHLTAPGSGADSATLIEFKNAQGKVLESLLLGKKHTEKSNRPSQTPWGNSDMPDGRFIMLKSDPHEVLTVSDPLNSVDPKPSGWLSKDFLKVEKVKSITLDSTNAANSWSLSRETESSPWVLAHAKAGEVLDTSKVSSLSSTLSYPSFVDIATNASAAKPLVVTMTTFDHFTYTIKIGAKNSDNDYDMSVSVTANFPTERTPGKNEKPDEKKKLDKEFQDNLKAQQDKLKQEQALNNWTYVVNSWLVDPLIRNRAELMVAKNDEKKDKKNGTASAGAPKIKSDDSDADLFPTSAPSDQ